jgi:hypothetical protein
MRITPVSTLAAAILMASVFVAHNAQVMAQDTNPSSSANAAAAEPAVYKSELGFSYGYPSDWELVDTKPMLPSLKLQEQEKAANDNEKRGAACTQIGLLLRHGSPASVMMTMALPYDCYGTHFATSDLAGFGTGVSSGLKQSFDIKDEQYSAYKSGSHNLWIERAKGTAKNNPGEPYTIETVCALLGKGAVCWMGMMKDDAGLKIFEQGQVTLEGDAPTALVPAGTFAGVKQ